MTDDRGVPCGSTARHPAPASAVSQPVATSERLIGVESLRTIVSSEFLAGLPRWLVFGAILGLLGSVCVVGVFLLATRYLPDGRPSGRGTTGESRRRQEFRAYLRAIDEPFAEGHVVEGQRVAFYLPKRDVAITFDPRAYYRILGSGTEPVLVEHEMPGRVLGARLPFETPDLDFGDVGATPDPIRQAFAELGVPLGAHADDVKGAYRRRVKDVHPDQGGSEADFKRLREAYATAKRHAESAQRP